MSLATGESTNEATINNASISADTEYDSIKREDSNTRNNIEAASPNLLDDYEEREKKKKAKNKKKESPFEKLNTLKLLYDCGHLSQDEYKVHSNRIYRCRELDMSFLGKKESNYQ